MSDKSSGEVTSSRPRRIGILSICCMSLFIVGIDVTIVNVALPSIGRELHASVSGLQWTVDAYTLVLGSLLMASGSLADRLGRRRVFQVGLGLFTLGSLACSLAPSLALLVVFRMLQAVGGSMLNPVAMSIIRNTFHEPRERAQAIGIWGAVIGISMALGPLLGGVLVESIDWRAIFWVNVPVGLAAIALTALYVPESRAPKPRRIDLFGQLAVIVFLASLIYAIIEGAKEGWTSPLIISLFVLAALAVTSLVVWDQRREEPLVDIRFFASVPFSGATIVAVGAFVSLSGFLFLNTLYLQDVKHLSAFDAGLDTLPMAGMTMLLSPISGYLVGRVGARISLVVGGAGLGLGALLLTSLAADTSFSRLFISYVVFGIGFGVVNAPITNTAISGMPASQAGVASAIASTSRQVGSALGVAVVGAIAASGLAGTSINKGFAAATHVGWWIITASGAAVLVLGILTTTPYALRTARSTAKLFEGDDEEEADSLVASY